MRTARFWHPVEGDRIQCDLCPHHCVMGPGGHGRCGVRMVEGAALVAAGYGVLSSVHVDPVEKKPLYHFHPGTLISSIGGWGCNFRCEFCQNWSISQQFMRDGACWTPEAVAAMASEGGSIGMAYTYNEPLIDFEFVMDCAALVRERGRVNVLVTNGFLEPSPAMELIPLIDAFNIDIKSMSDDFYQARCGGRLQPVLTFAKTAVGKGAHVEITNLVIPGLNDEADEIERLARWISDDLGASTPLHLSAYFPQYKLSVPATGLDSLRAAQAICRRYLHYVYLGNVQASGDGHDTRCRWCDAVLVVRRGYDIRLPGIRDGKCQQCGKGTDIVVEGATRSE